MSQRSYVLVDLLYM